MSRKIGLFAFMLVFLSATAALANIPLSFTWLQPTPRSTVTAGQQFDISVGIVGTNAPKIDSATLTILDSDNMSYATVPNPSVTMGDVTYECKVSGSYTFPANAPVGNYTIKINVYDKDNNLLGSSTCQIAVQAP